MHNGKLQVGIIGVGGIGRDQHLPGWAQVPFAEVAAAADVSAQALQQAAAAFKIPRLATDWHDLLEVDGLDVIDICTPSRTHAALALAALDSGKHVLCEKPLATTTEEVQLLRDAAKRSGRLLMAAQHLRFDPICRRLKAWIDEGRLGDIYYVRAQYLRRRLVPPRATFIEKRLSGGGPVLDLGVHVLDLAYWYLGAPPPFSVSALVEAKLAHRDDLTGNWGDWDRARYDVEDFAAGFVRFSTGAALMLETSWLAFQAEREILRLQCFGTQGGVAWPDGLLVGENRRIPWTMKVDDVPYLPPHHEEILQFARAVRDGLPSPIPVEQSLNVIKILEGFYRSGHLKREVVLQ